MSVDVLFRCSRVGDTQGLKRFFADTERDRRIVNRRDAVSGMCAIHCAAQRGNKMVIKTLLSNDADLRARDKEGKTALHWSVLYDWESITDFLLDQDDDSKSNSHNSNSNDLLVNLCDWRGVSPLMLAVSAGLESQVDLLLSRGGDPFLQDERGCNALFYACFYGKTKIAKTILAKTSKKVDLLWERSIDGYTAVHSCARGGHDALLGSLLRIAAESGVHVSTYVNAAGNDGNTPLFITSAMGHANVARVLLENGADVTIVNGEGKFASAGAKMDMVRLLKARASVKNSKLSGGGTRRGKTGEESAFDIVAIDQFGGSRQFLHDDLLVTVVEPGGRKLSGKELRKKYDSSTGTWHVVWVPRKVGYHEVTVAMNGDPFPGSPFSIEVEEGVGGAWEEEEVEDERGEEEMLLLLEEEEQVEEEKEKEKEVTEVKKTKTKKKRSTLKEKESMNREETDGELLNRTMQALVEEKEAKLRVKRENVELQAQLIQIHDAHVATKDKLNALLVEKVQWEKQSGGAVAKCKCGSLANAVMLPCCHMAQCFVCVAKSFTCPVCMEKKTGFIRVQMPEKKKEKFRSPTLTRKKRSSSNKSMTMSRASGSKYV